MFVRVLTVVGLAIGGISLWGGSAYYLTPPPERPFSPLHGLYAPTGLVGQGFGIIGTLMIVTGVALYAARKRISFLARVGKLRDWLHFHIFLCLLGPFLILLHTTFKFGGFVAISFWSMALVVGSGVFGRYVYVWIPKTMNGRFLGAEEVRQQMHGLLREVEGQIGLTADQLLRILRPSPQAATTPSVPVLAVSGTASALLQDGPPAPRELRGVAGSIDALFQAASPLETSPRDFGGQDEQADAPADRRSQPRPGPDRRRRGRPRLGILGAVGASLRYRFGRRRERARFHRELSAAGVSEPMRSRIVGHLEAEGRIEQQLHLLQPFQRAFRYWHAFHRPLTIVMFVVLVGHVGVAIAFGYTWIF